MQKTAKKWLSEEETDKLLEYVKNQSREDYLCLMLCRYGLRIGEILGRGKLPGIHVQDLRDNGIWIVGKGYSHEGEAPSLYPLSSSFAKELTDFANSNHRPKDAKLFSFGVRRMEIAIKVYAKDAGIVDSQLVGPHRLRAFFRNGPRREGTDSIPNTRHDAPQEYPNNKRLRWPQKPRLPTWNHGKVSIQRFSNSPRPRGFWLLGVGVLVLSYHLYGIFSGAFWQFNLVSYEVAFWTGVAEVFFVVIGLPVFLVKLVIWWHDRPYVPKHHWDDQNILD